MPKKTIKMLRAASRAKSSSGASPEAKVKPDLLSKKNLGKKARLHAKANGKLQVLDRRKKSKEPRKQELLSELELQIRSQKQQTEIKAEVSTVQTLTSNKLKGAVAVRETNRMKMVMENSSFQSNPLAVLRAHIQQSQHARNSRKRES